MLATMLLSHTSDGAAGATWPQRDVDAKSYWWQYCEVMLVTVLPGRLHHDAIMLLSHAGDDAGGVTWPQRDIDVESCWRQCC
jgi:hypothetical protein